MNKIAVIGDIMLDRRIQCEIIGLSPEDDLTPKLKAIKESYSPGGAANVAANIISLGGKAFLYGVIGNDQNGNNINPCYGELIITDRQTTTKTRYVTPRGRHVARIDREDTNPISPKESDQLLDNIKKNSPYDIIIISDYAKGVITPEIIEGIHNLKTPIIVDPKGTDFIKYGEVLAITPNELEMQRKIGGYLASYLVTTLGGLGCMVWNFDGGITKIKARTREVGDPTGCGDSFIAGLGVALSDGKDFITACRMATAAGSCAVDHDGVYAVTMKDLMTEYNYLDA